MFVYCLFINIWMYRFIDTGGSPGGEGGGWVYLLADQRSTYVFWSLFLCFLFFLLDMLMFFFLFFCFLMFFCYLCLCSCFFFSFFSSRRLFVSILSLQTASPTFKNDGFTMEILIFLKNQRFRRPKKNDKKVTSI